MPTCSRRTDHSCLSREVEGSTLRKRKSFKTTIKPVPAYAPNLNNPVEWMRKQRKKVELRNPTCLDLEQPHRELHVALGRQRQKRALVRPFFEGGELEL